MTVAAPKPRLVLVVTSPMTFATTLAGQLRMLATRYELTLVCGEGDEEFAARAERQEGLPLIRLPLTRQITPGADARAVAMLSRLLRQLRPAMVQTYTPKAGLVGMIAARLAGVPVRVHGVVGMPLMEARGARALALHASERATYLAATHLSANSVGLRDWMWQHLSTRPITVVGDGSINGIDTERFQPPDPAERRVIRERLGVSASACLAVFVGRVVRDKGVVELLEAVRQVRAAGQNLELVLVGDEEAHLDPLPPESRALLAQGEGVRLTGFVDDVRPWLAAADLFVLPSYREGLPNSLLEAAAMGLPSVVTDINGCREVVYEGQTGLRVPVRDTEALRRALSALVADSLRRESMGQAAREDVLRRFDQRQVFWPALIDFYERLRAV